MPEPARFVFATCQVGAEAALKHEFTRDWPELRFAFSRPGFVTFKHAAGETFADDFNVRSVSARTFGVSLGKAIGGTAEDRARLTWQLIGNRPVEDLHVYPRDCHEVGYRGYQPVQSDQSKAAEALLRASAACPEPIRNQTPPPAPSPQAGPLVADVILVEPEEWWIGCHRARRLIPSRAGGFLPLELPDEAVSRVYLKMVESLLWSGFRLQPGQTCVEIGCAPGGASQALLERGLKVIGIDPAEMASLVAEHPNFRQIRRRSKDVPRREFLGVDWLTCDINLPPNYTLDTVEAIVKYPKVKIRGMILTLKLIEWSLADEIPGYLERIRGWGFRQVRARQLHHNRQEVCVVARK